MGRRVQVQHEHLGLAVHLLLGLCGLVLLRRKGVSEVLLLRGVRLLALVVVVPVGVLVLELVLIVVGMVLAGMVREVGGAGLQLLEGALVWAALRAHLVVLAPLFFVAGVVLVGCLGLHLGRVAPAATAAPRVVVVVVVVGSVVIRVVAALVLLLEVAIALGLAVVFGEVALVVGCQLRLLHLVPVVLLLKLGLLSLLVVLLLLGLLLVLLVVEVASVLGSALAQVLPVLASALVVVSLAPLASAAHVAAPPLVRVVVGAVLTGPVVAAAPSMTARLAVPARAPRVLPCGTASSSSLVLVVLPTVLLLLLLHVAPRIAPLVVLLVGVIIALPA